MKCPHCDKESESKGGMSFHIWRKHTEEGKNFDPNKRVKNGELIQWNKGKKFEDVYDVEKIKRLKEGCSKGGKALKGTHLSEARKKNLSIKAKQNKLGGYTKGGGRGKHGWYKGYWCDSSWELAWVIYNLDHNIDFKRNTEKFPYIYNDKIKHFIPDFIINNEFIEIKGWKNKITEEKIKQFNYPITVLYGDDLKEIFEYVIKSYGKDFIKLYEIQKYE